ncbi:MAG: hypothetical protein R3F61_23520 [Myxococcota bacterium]
MLTIHLAITATLASPQSDPAPDVQGKWVLERASAAIEMNCNLRVTVEHGAIDASLASPLEIPVFPCDPSGLAETLNENVLPRCAYVVEVHSDAWGERLHIGPATSGSEGCIPIETQLDTVVGDREGTITFPELRSLARSAGIRFNTGMDHRYGRREITPGMTVRDGLNQWLSADENGRLFTWKAWNDEGTFRVHHVHVGGAYWGGYHDIKGPYHYETQWWVQEGQVFRPWTEQEKAEIHQLFIDRESGVITHEAYSRRLRELVEGTQLRPPEPAPTTESYDVFDPP